MEYPAPLTKEDRDHYFTILRDSTATDTERDTARNLIVTRSLRIVEAELRPYRRRASIDLDDLRQVGTIALIEAVNAVDHPAAFYEYARITVKYALMHHAVTDQAAGVTGAATDRLREAARIEQHVNELEAVGLTRTRALHTVAAGIGKPVEYVADLLRAVDAPVSLDMTPDIETGSHTAAAADHDLMEQAHADMEAAAVRDIIATLPEKEAVVVARRLGIDPAGSDTASIAKRLGVTHRQVGVLERRGMARLRHPSRAWRLAQALT